MPPENQVQENRALTLGEYRVGISFNPGGHPEVNAVKKAAADLIDILDSMQLNQINAIPVEDGKHQVEVMRLYDKAMDDIENAAMWAVKAITKSAR